mmetsp:Transcript_6302/g.14458  ORF Transcript_6302/g.14458 Transcript_6302/m.14458 type:complete len:241 (+) Transcript_6302:114-836(+)
MQQLLVLAETFSTCSLAAVKVLSCSVMTVFIIVANACSRLSSEASATSTSLGFTPWCFRLPSWRKLRSCLLTPCSSPTLMRKNNGENFMPWAISAALMVHSVLDALALDPASGLPSAAAASAPQCSRVMQVSRAAVSLCTGGIEAENPSTIVKRTRAKELLGGCTGQKSTRSSPVKEGKLTVDLTERRRSTLACSSSLQSASSPGSAEGSFDWKFWFILESTMRSARKRAPFPAKMTCRR